MIDLRIIGGKFKSRSIDTVKVKTTRPSTDKIRESIFNILNGYINGGVCLDLFGGSGSLGYEAISRGIDKTVFVDKGQEAIKVIRKNASTLGVESQVEIYRQDYKVALKVLAKRQRQFDLIFLDPPFPINIMDDLITNILDNNILANDGIIVARVEQGIEINKSYKDLNIIKDTKYGISLVTMFIKGEL